MDLNLYLRVIWRFWWLVLIGLIVATVLAVLSVYRVDTGTRSSTGRRRSG